MKILSSLTVFLLSIIFTYKAEALPAFPEDYEKKRVFVSTDIGGGDQDDYQSLVHLLLYHDMFDLEGIIASYPEVGRSWWRSIMASYRIDYKKLSLFSADYLPPRELQKRFKLGSKSKFRGNNPSAGANLLIKQALKDDPRPLHVLVWGSATDLAQALKQKPAIAKNIRVFIIGGWNTAQDRAAFEFVENMQKRKKFKMIVTGYRGGETGRGIYLTGLHSKRKYGNVGFVKRVVKKHGSLGRAFHANSSRINVNRYGIKMGDTPSVFYVMNGSFKFDKKTTPPSWGGRYCRVRKNFYADCLNRKKFNLGSRYKGAKTISTHRRDYLKDFEERLKRLKGLDGITP